MGERQREGDRNIGFDDRELPCRDSDASLTPAVYGKKGCCLGRGPDGDTKVDIAEVALRSGKLQLRGITP